MHNKILITLFCSLLSVGMAWADEWTEEELRAANTAANASYMSQEERDVILYINLARLYPRRFSAIEIEGYEGVPGYTQEPDFYRNRASLVRKLYNSEPVGALIPNQDVYNGAACFAAESGNNGLVGHEHIQCPKKYHGECCSYGLKEGKYIALELLIDTGVSNLIHREICLDGAYEAVGVAQHSHTKWGICTVLDVLLKKTYTCPASSSTHSPVCDPVYRMQHNTY